MTLSVRGFTDASPDALYEGEDLDLQLAIEDSATGTPISGLYPAVWIDLKRPSQAGVSCPQKVASFLQGVLAARPEVDLNAWFILTMNTDTPNISVVDPLVDFSGQKLLALIELESRGEDWAMTEDQEVLFVTQPDSNKLAVADLRTWEVVKQIEVGERPMRVVLQPDEGYVWVGNDSLESEYSGVTVVDPQSLEVVARFNTGAGHHEFAFSADNRWAFVTNSRSDKLTIIDIGQMRIAQELALSTGLNDVAYSPLSETVVAVNAVNGEVHVVDANTHESVTMLRSESGLTFVDFSADGRWGAVLNRDTNTVSIFDAATSAFVGTAVVGEVPDHALFTRQNLHVFSLGTASVTSIPISALGQLDTLPTIELSTGQLAPSSAGVYSLAPAMVLTPDNSSLLIANAADRAVYFYMEGMVAPMGSFAEKRQARAARTVNRAIRGQAPGVYGTNTSIPGPGVYDVAVKLDNPEIVHCFQVTVAEDPQLKAQRSKRVTVAYAADAARWQPGQAGTIRFQLIEQGSQRPLSGVTDVNVRILRIPGAQVASLVARDAGEGFYEAEVSLPERGLYHVLIQSSSQNLALNKTIPKEIFIR